MPSRLKPSPIKATSTAVALMGRYFLPYRAALNAEYRDYTDTWGIDGSSFELGYTHPINDAIILELSYRVYDQNEADFYADLFPYQDAQNFLARDKELSAFSSSSIGIGGSYEFKFEGKIIDKATLNFFYNFFHFDYENFRDLTVESTPGEEPLYELDAHVIRAFVSIWF
jgi:hypothetical protein